MLLEDDDRGNVSTVLELDVPELELLGEDDELVRDPGLLLEDDEEVVNAVVELDAPELELLEKVVEELEELEETRAGFMYMLSLLDPPQYSEALPLQT